MIQYNSYKTVLYIYIIGFVLLFSATYLIGNYDWAKKLNKSCFMRAPDNVWNVIKNYRGQNYYLTVIERRKRHRTAVLPISCQLMDPQPTQSLFEEPPGPESIDESNCLITGWAVSHMISYAFLGFFAPEFFWETFLFGVIFEILENFTADCHDILDVLWNTIGFIFGALLHKFFNM